MRQQEQVTEALITAHALSQGNGCRIPKAGDPSGKEEAVENTSGQGKAALVPSEIKRWNWGAFLLNWIWGLGNRTYIALLCLIPLVNIVMIFVLGAKGSEWAWRNKRWQSIEHFRRVQRKWAW